MHGERGKMEYILLLIAAVLLLRKKNVIAYYDWWTTTLTPIRKTIFTANQTRPVTIRIYNGDADGAIIIYEVVNGIDVLVTIEPHETKEIFLAANNKLDGATHPGNPEANIFYIATFTP